MWNLKVYNNYNKLIKQVKHSELKTLFQLSIKKFQYSKIISESLICSRFSLNEEEVLLLLVKPIFIVAYTIIINHIFGWSMKNATRHSLVIVLHWGQQAITREGSFISPWEVRGQTWPIEPNLNIFTLCLKVVIDTWCSRILLRNW